MCPVSSRHPHNAGHCHLFPKFCSKLEAAGWSSFGRGPSLNVRSVRGGGHVWVIVSVCLRNACLRHQYRPTLCRTPRHCQCAFAHRLGAILSPFPDSALAGIVACRLIVGRRGTLSRQIADLQRRAPPAGCGQRFLTAHCEVTKAKLRCLYGSKYVSRYARVRLCRPFWRPAFPAASASRSLCRARSDAPSQRRVRPPEE